jgi:hypothetical protein
MSVEHIVHRHCGSHFYSVTATEPPGQPPTSAVRGEASLGVLRQEFAVDMW